MPAFDNIIKSAAENLLGDERWRSNLMDPEAKLVLDWALSRLKAQANSATDEASARKITQSELARLRLMLNAINAVAAKPGALRLSEIVAAVEPSLQIGRPFTRQEVFGLVTTLVGAVWQLRDKITPR